MLTEFDIDGLKTYFSNRTDVAFAFLFGSQAAGNATKLSDVDIAVYFYPERKHPVEYEEEVYYRQEDALWLELERLLRIEVELIVLNRIPSTIAASALKGIPLAINDWGLYLDFVVVVTSVADDFMDFVIRDYMEKQRQ